MLPKCDYHVRNIKFLSSTANNPKLIRSINNILLKTNVLVTIIFFSYIFIVIRASATDMNKSLRWTRFSEKKQSCLRMAGRFGGQDVLTGELVH